MPTVSQNLELWNRYDWPHEGDEWSDQFGGTEALWAFLLYPRIRRFLPAPSILEIAPGYGRWTQYLQGLCRSMIAIDISEKCIEHCKTRFAANTHIRFYGNDGFSLAAVPDDSIDFAFSFDSLVHAESDVMKSYLAQLATKLKPDGIGFFHHSNIGAYKGRLAVFDWYRRLPLPFREHVLKVNRLEALLSINLRGARATSMTASLFRQYCERAGLKCVSQEIINWVTGRSLTDAISVFTKPGSRWDKPFTVFENFRFVEGALVTKRLARLYGESK